MGSASSSSLSRTRYGLSSGAASFENMSLSERVEKLKDLLISERGEYALNLLKMLNESDTRYRDNLLKGGEKAKEIALYEKLLDELVVRIAHKATGHKFSNKVK